MIPAILELDSIEHRVSIRLARRDHVPEHLYRRVAIIDDPLTVLELVASVVDICQLSDLIIPVEVEVRKLTIRLSVVAEMPVGNSLSEPLGVESTLSIRNDPATVKLNSPLIQALKRSTGILVEVYSVIDLLDIYSLNDHYVLSVIPCEEVTKSVLRIR